MTDDLANNRWPRRSKARWMTLVVSPWLVQFSILFLVSLPFNLQYTDKGNKDLFRPQEGLCSAFYCYCCYCDVALRYCLKRLLLLFPDRTIDSQHVTVNLTVLFSAGQNDRLVLSLIYYSILFILSPNQTNMVVPVPYLLNWPWPQMYADGAHDHNRRHQVAFFFPISEPTVTLECWSIAIIDVALWAMYKYHISNWAFLEL
jgi:hypothetical protein